MLSVVIATDESERALVPTLVALVPGATAGLVREVIVADAGSRDATAEVADIAGCRLLVAKSSTGARLNAAAASARGSWLLFLRPGVVPAPAWIGEVARFIENEGGRDHAARFRIGTRSAARHSHLREVLAALRAVLGAHDAARGLLIPKQLYDWLGGHRDIGQSEVDLLRRLGRRRLVTLGCSVSVNQS
jgi:glycosyltransferase involved in cell wall biosynthesis